MKAEAFDEVLAAPQFQRQDPGVVDDAVASIGASLPPLLVEFFKRFRGPIGSNVIGCQLLDLVEDNPNVLSLTSECRRQFGFPSEWVVLSDLNAGALLVLDCDTEHVYDVDFEGGVELLQAGEIQPRWESVEALLTEYFEISGS